MPDIRQIGNPLAARESDPETGLYYYRARYYDPAPGRFLSEDPKRFGADANFYRYGFNDPVDNTDPLGLYTPQRHHDMTHDMAALVFGPKCESKAREVAEANRAVDDTHGFIEKFRFYTGRGDAWDKPGTHFPNPAMVHTQLSMAISSCSLKDLGRGLHSLQDSFAHAGVSPTMHKLVPLLDIFINFNNRVIIHSPLEDEALAETAGALIQFREKCLKCCTQ